MKMLEIESLAQHNNFAVASNSSPHIKKIFQAAEEVLEEITKWASDSANVFRMTVDCCWVRIKCNHNALQIIESTNTLTKLNHRTSQCFAFVYVFHTRAKLDLWKALQTEISFCMVIHRQLSTAHVSYFYCYFLFIVVVYVCLLYFRSFSTFNQWSVFLFALHAGENVFDNVFVCHASCEWKSVSVDLSASNV